MRNISNIVRLNATRKGILIYALGQNAPLHAAQPN